MATEGSAPAMKNLHRTLLCLALCLPTVALGQGGSNTTITNSTCTAYGLTDTPLVLLEETMGPGTILIGDRGSCTLQPPVPGCGTGTVSDPYDAENPACSGAVVASFTAGTPFEVLAGTNNINVNTVTFIPTAAAQRSTPVPLGPWVPLGSGLGIVLLALLWSHRGPGAR